MRPSDLNVTSMRDVDVLVKSMKAGLAQIEAIYNRDLTAKAVSDDLLLAVRRVIDDERSALDFVAHAINQKYGKPGRRAYFPITTADAEFTALLDKNIPNLSRSQPKIAAAVERYQPYHTEHEALRHLGELSRVNKHHGFTAQTREETRWLQAGQVGWNPDNVTFGGNVFIGGHRVDPQTQRPVGIPVVETVYVGWQFKTPPVPVLPTLRSIATTVEAATNDIRHVAGLL